MSPSSRGRGLKSEEVAKLAAETFVALFTRAWIEIHERLLALRLCASPSSRGRGLKSQSLLHVAYFLSVALFTRAWIEIMSIPRLSNAWMRSPSSRGRGLKYKINAYLAKHIWSPSSRGRGLKFQHYRSNF